MKRTVLIILVFSTALLAGCWDRIDIEGRSYVLGIAIDKYPSKEGSVIDKEKGEIERMELHTGKPLYAMTVQVPVLTKDTEQNMNVEDRKMTNQSWQITQIGNSFMSMNREMQSRISFPLFYEHLQVIIISEEVAREGIEKILDFFVRDHEMRRRVKIFISECDAKKVLEVEPRFQDYAAIYLALIPRNATKNSRMLHKMDLGEVINHLHAGYNFVLPKVTPVGTEIKASGGAAFHGDRMIGWLSELEIEAYKFIIGTYQGGVVTVELPEPKGLYTVEIDKIKTKIKPKIVDDIPSFTVDIKIKGNYASEEFAHTHGRLDEDLLKKVEKKAAEEIERICNLLIRKTQQEYKVDLFRLSLVLQTQEPEYWEKNGKEWETIYPTVDIKVKVDMGLQSVGVVR